MAEKEQIGVLCRIVLPAVLRLDYFAEKRDPERIQKTPQVFIRYARQNDSGCGQNSPLDAGSFFPAPPSVLMPSDNCF